MLTARTARPIDVDPIMDIIACAQRRMAQIGIDQWQDGYPPRSQIEADIARGVGQVFFEGDRPVGYGALIIGIEPAYERLRGHWLLPGAKYGAIHRTALADGCNGRGLGGELLGHFEQLARASGCDSVRIDTHRGNFPMLRLVERRGYVRCGEVEYDCAGDPVRAAYELLLEEEK